MPLELLKSLAWACCICWSTACYATVFDVYIAAGQSNMDGRGFRSELTGPLSSYASPQPEVLLRYTNPGNSDGSNAYQTNWVTLAPGYSVQPNFNGALPSTRFGPDVSYGKEMASKTALRQVAIIKVTRGSTSLEGDWNPSHGLNDPKGHMYEGFEQAVPQAIQALQALGHSVEIRGMIWHQGEADSSASSAQYQAKLTEFIQTVRQDLGYSNLPFLIGELESFPGSRDRTAVRTAQIAVASAMDFVEFVPSTGLPVQSDENHFTSAGVIELGLRFASTMQATISNLPGDFNRDGVVDVQDFQVWSNFQGSTIDARADANSDGVVDDLDFRIWQAAVPEPSACVLLCSALMFGIRHLRKRKRQIALNATGKGE
jgi:iduronate 2-sulfatase